MISVNPKRIKEPELIVKGLLLHRAGDWSAAMDVYGAVLRKHPKHAVALYLMGLLFESVNDQHRAWQLLDQACRIKPNFTEAWYNRGVVELWLGRHAAARESYERAIRLDPNFAPAFVNLGNVRMALGDHDGAIAAYERAAELRPDTPEGIHNRSFVYLLRGQWDRGWRDYEMRWNLPGHAAANPLPPGVPWWNGEPLAGKRIGLVHEQGAGDTLMALRYVPLIQAMGATVILRVPRSLERICRASFPAVEVEADDAVGTIGPQAPWPAMDYVLPLMSVPGRMGTMPDSVPMRETPYLVAPDGPVLPAGQGFKVAFVWKGSKDHKNDRNRSTPLSKWLPLLSIPGVTWYAVQQEVTEPERLALAKLPNVHLVGGLRDWGDTACVLSQVDALIAPDTGVVHLAGAMGVTTCVLISALPDFRWLLGKRMDAVWYASVGLHRQPTIGDWDTPLTQVAARLRAVIHEHERRVA